jgi:hypothetical protein
MFFAAFDFAPAAFVLLGGVLAAGAVVAFGGGRS